MRRHPDKRPSRRESTFDPLFVFNQFGELERRALRPGNVHSADGWNDVLKPVVARYLGKVSRLSRLSAGQPTRSRKARRHIRRGYSDMVDADLTKCFDSRLRASQISGSLDRGPARAATESADRATGRGGASRRSAPSRTDRKLPAPNSIAPAARISAASSHSCQSAMSLLGRSHRFLD
jgi:hypothetical protein